MILNSLLLSDCGLVESRCFGDCFVNFSNLKSINNSFSEVFGNIFLNHDTQTCGVMTTLKTQIFMIKVMYVILQMWALQG